MSLKLLYILPLALLQEERNSVAAGIVGENPSGLARPLKLTQQLAAQDLQARLHGIM